MSAKDRAELMHNEAKEKQHNALKKQKLLQSGTTFVKAGTKSKLSSPRSRTPISRHASNITNSTNSSNHSTRSNTMSSVRDLNRDD